MLSASVPPLSTPSLQWMLMHSLTPGSRSGMNGVTVRGQMITFYLILRMVNITHSSARLIVIYRLCFICRLAGAHGSRVFSVTNSRLGDRMRFPLEFPLWRFDLV